jgi:hypothetical protein
MVNHGVSVGGYGGYMPGMDQGMLMPYGVGHHAYAPMGHMLMPHYPAPIDLGFHCQWPWTRQLLDGSKVRPLAPFHTAMKKWRIVILRFGTARQKMVLD